MKCKSKYTIRALTQDHLIFQVLLGSEYITVRSEGEGHDTIRGYTSDINLERAERQRQMSKVN